MTTALNKRVLNDAVAITPDDLRSLYLFGVNLQNDNGDSMPDAMMIHYVLAATRWIEAEIPGLLLSPKTITDESHDYYYDDYQKFGAIQTKYFPVTDVAAYNVAFPLQSAILKFDPTWLQVNSVSGQINLIPSSGSLSSIIIGAGGAFLPLLYGTVDHIPDIIKITYTAGFDANTIPANIKDIIGMKAALGPLNIAGDLIAGAGVASKSISIDGVSQSINTTASAMYTGYGAKMEYYQKEIKEQMIRLRRYYEGIQMVTA